MNDGFDTTGSAPSGVSPRKWARLENFLGALPPAAAGKLFAALESGAGGGLPAAPVLKILRTRLVFADAPFPARRVDARRLFFAPFEDFFISGRKGRKRRARIDRASLAPIWRLVEADPACAGAARAAADLDAALARGVRDPALEKALFDAAAEGFLRLIEHAESDAAFRADLSARLGGRQDKAGAAALHDLAEINLLLPAAEHLKAAQESFARPTDALTEEDVYEARRVYAACAATHPQAAPYVLLAIAGRVSSIERALPIYYHFMRVHDDAIPDAAADASLIVEAAFDDIESLARALERDGDDDPDMEGAPARFEAFAALAAGLAGAVAREGDTALVNRIEAGRDVAEAALARFCEVALNAMRRAQPTRHAGGSSRLMALRPDIARAIDPQAERAAAQGAQFLARAVALGQALDREGAAREFVDAARAETRRYAGDLVAEIRAAEGADRASAMKRMDHLLRAAAPLVDEAEIALLKERANAASVSA